MGNKLSKYLDIMACHNEVTGSCFLCVLRLPDREKVKFLVDCGLFQGNEKEDEILRYNEDFPFDASEISFVLVTHNHTDHVGRLPLLVKKGFVGKIYASKGTQILLPNSLFDSESHLTENYKRRHLKPIYNEKDVKDTISRVQGIEYNKKIKATPNISVTFYENAHIPGAAMIFVEIECRDEEPINLFFTGDYASHNDFLDISPIPEDVLNKRINIVTECTYGTTKEEDINYGYFRKEVSKALRNDKTVVIPALSQGRAQTILYELKKMQCEGEVDVNIPIYFDGRLAHNYTRLYLKDNGLIKDSMKDFLPENVTFVDRDIREQVLTSSECKVIVTTSGMGSHGPAQVYIPYYILDKNCLIMFTCYTPEGTVGYDLQNVERGEKVRIYGMIKKKNAEVLYSSEFSSHAKQEELLKLLKLFKDIRTVIINHGEPDVKEKFAEIVYDEVNTKSVCVINRDFLFRIGSYGVEKTMSTKFIK